MTQALPRFNEVPEALKAPAESLWQDYLQRCDEGGNEPVSDPQVLATVPLVFTSSEFAARVCVRQPHLLGSWVEEGSLLHSIQGQMGERTSAAVASCASEAEFTATLRRFRQAEMARLAWRDIAGWAPVEETLAEVSALADACIGVALEYAQSIEQAAYGIPAGETGETQSLVVIGMGKLGGRELNFSSDIDLIFAYPEPGETRGGPRSTTNEQYFLRLCRRLIRLLDEATADGFVFRVDARLRPYGDSGPLAMSFEAMEEYYQSQGREWERYAWIKARVVAGASLRGEELLLALRPFVYRRYLDFGAFESLREMKMLIRRELERKGIAGNVKLGAGGIREVEFIGQAFQLIRGGRVAELRERGILRVLALLAEFDYLPRYVASQLQDAYLFLRRTENRLQQFRDQQTHLLPKDAEGRLRLAFSLGFESWEALLRELDNHRDAVHSYFDQVFAAPQSDHAESEEEELALVWHGTVERTAALKLVRQRGLEEADRVLELLEELRQSRACRAMSARARTRLDRLMPLLLGAVAANRAGVAALERVIPLLECIALRSAYIALLVENPMALSQLVRLTSASSWIARQLMRFPLLLDELLDPRTLYAPPDKKRLREELGGRLAAIESDDLEQHMDALRVFKLANVLRVAAADVSGAVPLMRVSDHLTWIAEVVLEAALGVARNYMRHRHGRIVCGAPGEEREAGFVIVAYGKFGGIELGYGSDLDLVFIHEPVAGDAESDGDKPIASGVYFARLAQRLIHILTASTAAGPLYEVDMRLRPSGNSGLLVTALDGFERYQCEEAWTWEHQALVRARVVAGDDGLAAAFEAVRGRLLATQRNAELLRAEVREMRAKMRAQLDKSSPELFDLKQGVGGITDIEFMVQYGVLNWAHHHPSLVTYSDNIRQLEALSETGLIAQPDADFLAEAFRTYRRRVHRLALEEQPGVVPVAEFQRERCGVEAFWVRFMGETQDDPGGKQK